MCSAIKRWARVGGGLRVNSARRALSILVIVPLPKSGVVTADAVFFAGVLGGGIGRGGGRVALAG